MTSPSTGRNARIDFVRGIAISSVLLLHFALAYGLQHCPLNAVFSLDQLKALFYNGNFGVTAFFVVSGYLITSMSLGRWGRLSQIPPTTFYRLRFARILPSLLLVLAIIVVLGSLGLPHFSNTDGGHHLPASYFFIAVGSVLTFWHNVLMASQGWFNYCLNIYWSLSVEEVFYLALPLCALLLRRTRWFAVLCVALMAYAPLYRYQHLDNDIVFMCGDFACFDAIAIGCLTALAARRWVLRGPLARGLRLAAGLAFVLLYLRGIGDHEVFGFTLIALSIATYLFAAVNDSAPGFATARATGWIRWLGRHSYELYLYHIIVLATLRNVFERKALPADAWLPWLGLFLAVSALLAYLVARWVSEPANAALRRRFVGASSTSHGNLVTLAVSNPDI